MTQQTWYQAIWQAAEAARALLDSGEDVGSILRDFREAGLGPMGSIAALQEVAPIGLGSGKMLVESACSGVDYSHLRLEHLRLLAGLEELPGRLCPSFYRDAILFGRPTLRCVASPHGGVDYFWCDDEGPPRGRGSRTLDSIRQELLTVASSDAWRDRMRVLRAEPEVVVLHFPVVATLIVR